MRGISQFKCATLLVFLAHLTSCGSSEALTEVKNSDFETLLTSNFVVCTDALNVRNDALEVVGQAYRGDRLIASEKRQVSNGIAFQKVSFTSGMQGWVASSFICPANFSGDLSQSGKGRIEISIFEGRLKFYKGENLVFEANVGTGRVGHDTPRGKFKIVSKEKCPPYYGDGSKNVPGCIPENPFGTRAMWFVDGIYGVHGTNEPWLIEEGSSPEERKVSKGCVRMNTKLVEKLYEHVRVGDSISIK